MKRGVILGLAIFILFSMMSWGAATISLIATPSVVASGGKTVISWTTTGASKVYLNGVGYVSLNGSRNYYPTKTTTYTVQAYGSTGWVSKSVTVTVSSGNVPTVSFSATPTVITLGGSATLQWNVQNASSISINQGIGSVAASGSTAVTPTATTTYTLTATNSYGTKTASVSVAVQAPLPTITTTVTPDPIQLGQPVVISWTTQYANQVTIDQGIGAVALNGSITVALTKTITYTFTASGPGGTATRQLTFTLPELPIVTLTAQPAEVNAGDAATLVWTSENATELTLEPGIGAVAASGSMIVYPQATTTYKLVAVGGAGQAQATATVTVLSGRKIRAFAVHGSERVISVINLETQGVIRDIPLAFEPAGLALTRDGMWLYIADPANNQVQRMSTQDYALTKVYAVPGVPSELAVSEDGDYLFVAGKAGGCDGSGSYCFHTIDLKSGQIVRGLSFANELSSLCLDSSRHLLYALSRENKTVWALDAAALIAGQSAQEVIRSQLELDKTVNALTLAGDNSTLYAATDENISYIELNNFYMNYWLAIKDQDGTVLPIQYVVGMPDGSKLLVLLKRDAYKLIVFNQQTNALSMIPFAAAGSSFARLHPDGLRMVIATSGSPL
ncbi:MAG: hypothetical protein PHX05_11225, partial [Acidobacteriota bacterium]|nr:hypothetical protein [Acidobacteriota bacterium]